MFTDGHAVDRFTSFYYSNSIDSIDTLVDFAAIKSKYWNDESDLDLKRRKEAEFLILGDIPADAILGFAVYNEEADQQVRSMKYFNNKKLVVKQEYYF